MKGRVFVFILVLLSCLGALPLLNDCCYEDASDNNAQEPWWVLSRLYNVDSLLGDISRVLYPLGISIDPDQVVIGRDGWLFLGNAHDEVIAQNHAGVSPDTIKAALLRDATLAAWQYWYRNQGVVFLGEALIPNKETIYADKTPDWAKPIRPSPTDALLTAPFAEHYFDARTRLAATRERDPVTPLYLKTDTHWNDWGAWLSYQSLGQWLKTRTTQLDWPEPDKVKLRGWALIPGGDLARFLRLSSVLPDDGPLLDVASSDGDRLNTGKKLLWIRDSFGDAWEPYVSATFPDVSTIHWRDAFDHGATALLARMKSFKPDYVLYSVVERSLYAEAFTVPPPLLVTFAGEGFKSGPTVNYGKTNDLMPSDVLSFKVSGADPYWEFLLAPVVSPQSAPVLAFNLLCEATLPSSVNMQLFWAEKSQPMYAQNERSIAFVARPGVNYVHLAGAPLWVLSEEVVKMRMDVETLGACQQIGLTDVRFGKFVH